jgi:hypothetical protein
VHFADPATVGLLSYVVPRLENRRVLLLGTYRPEDVEIARHPLRQALRALPRRVLSELEPSPFGVREVRRYLEEALGTTVPADLVRFVHARTEGNPLFVVNMLDHLLSSGAVQRGPGGAVMARSVSSIEENVPQGLMAVLQDRIDRLDDGDRRLLQAGSVQGDVFEAAVIAPMVAEDELLVEERLDRIQRVHRLVLPLGEAEFGGGEVSARFRFVHALPRRVLQVGHPQAPRALAPSGGSAAPAAAAPISTPRPARCRSTSSAAASTRVRSNTRSWPPTTRPRLSPREAGPQLERALELSRKLERPYAHSWRKRLLIRLWAATTPRWPDRGRRRALRARGGGGDRARCWTPARPRRARCWAWCSWSAAPTSAPWSSSCACWRRIRGGAAWNGLAYLFRTPACGRRRWRRRTARACWTAPTGTPSRASRC